MQASIIGHIRIRGLVKRILRKYGSPPERQDPAPCRPRTFSRLRPVATSRRGARVGVAEDG